MDIQFLNDFSFVTCGYAKIENDYAYKSNSSCDLKNAEKLEKRWSTLLPIFPYHRLYLITEGSTVFHLANSTDLQLQKNNMYLIPPFMLKEGEQNSNNSHFYLHFKSNSPTVDPFEYYNVNNSAVATDDDKEIFKRLLENFNVNTLQSKLIVQGCFDILMSKFFTNNVSYSKKYQKFIPVIEYIDNNLDKKISVKDLADILHYDESFFSVIFSNEFKVSPMKYVLNKKMIIARQQLARNDMSIKEISSLLGFENEFYFNAVFKKAVGVPPGAWRKEFFLHGKDEL